ncbi:MAG: hypothetical protein JWN14_4 [Chthonomonadales bacterium]|nr:hypothetical protein [Chthonomonadales bacterium]
MQKNANAEQEGRKERSQEEMQKNAEMGTSYLEGVLR